METSNQHTIWQTYITHIISEQITPHHVFISGASFSIHIFQRAVCPEWGHLPLTVSQYGNTDEYIRTISEIKSIDTRDLKRFTLVVLQSSHSAVAVEELTLRLSSMQQLLVPID